MTDHMNRIAPFGSVLNPAGPDKRTTCGLRTPDSLSFSPHHLRSVVRIKPSQGIKELNCVELTHPRDTGALAFRDLLERSATERE